ncbi:MAG TPA: bifunctional UDP-sugar hydrolase/5'-nucleotidase [Oscillatoriaceae cyanobacterium]
MLRRIACASLVWAVLGVPALAKPVDLTIIHTNDTHDHLEPFDTPTTKDVGGVARRAGLFDQIRATTRNVMFLDAGDVCQGTPIFTLFGGSPDFDAAAACGYDAFTVGNHDLDNGLAALRTYTKGLKQPELSCNLTDAKGHLLWPAYHVFERGGLKIAVIGVMSEDAFLAVAADKRQGVVFHDPEPILKQLVAQLRPKADLVVLLSHSGYDREMQYAKELTGVDVIVGGHSHTKLDHPVPVTEADGRTTLVTQAYCYGEYAGRIDLTVDHQRIQKWSGELLPIDASLKPDAKVAAIADKYNARIEAKMNEVVGQAAVPFISGDKSNGNAPIVEMVADVLRAEGHADVGLMNSGGVRSSLPQGKLTRGMIFTMLPFPNRLVVLKATGEQLQQVLDYTAAKVGHEGALEVSGVTFVDAGGKATDVKVGGAPLDPAKTYTLATIDYIANGNDGATVFKQFADVQPTGALARDAFFDYLKTHALTAPQGDRILHAPAATH